MSQPEIAIVDYQMGNLRSVQKALEHVGFQATITNRPEEIAAAHKVILPGVGGFGDAIGELRSQQLEQPILEAIAAGKPFLGICLGLQLLFEVGLEGGTHAGLGVLPGSVERFPTTYPQELGLKVPHMGWNQVVVQQPGCPLWQGIPEDAYFYFVHSYYVRPSEPAVRWLSCDYGQQFCAAVWRDNLFATQFHPEKSQQHGLQLLKNFAAL
ncbi:MAG: imidazole glycerol phosphate synthase subunit HisH [Planctomycetales bacterium]|nr:imidazole glycerol phosphate synthase subunit HisH [Planctomycetales bacterium]